MVVKKSFNGKEFEIDCGRFDNRVKVFVNGRPALKFNKNFYRVNLPDGEFLQFEIEGSYITGMDLIIGKTRTEVFRHIAWYEYIYIFAPLLFLAFGAVLGIERGVGTTLGIILGGSAGLIFALAGFFSNNVLFHTGLKLWQKILFGTLIFGFLIAAFCFLFVYFEAILKAFGIV